MRPVTRVAALLVALGFPDVQDYVPGKLAWLAAGMPSEGQHSNVDRAGSLAREAATCAMDDDVATASDCVREHDVCVVVDARHLLVTTLAGELLGLISRDDLLRL